MRRILTRLFLLALLTTIPLADALCTKFCGPRRGFRCNHRRCGGRSPRCSRRRCHGCRDGEPPAASARPLLLAPRSLLGPDIKRKITSGIEPILPLIDIWSRHLRNGGGDE